MNAIMIMLDDVRSHKEYDIQPGTRFGYPNTVTLIVLHKYKVHEGYQYVFLLLNDTWVGQYLALEVGVYGEDYTKKSTGFSYTGAAKFSVAGIMYDLNHVSSYINVPLRKIKKYLKQFQAKGESGDSFVFDVVGC